MNPDLPTPDELAADRPPILGTWQRMYGLVLGVSFAVVVLLYWLTKVYQ